MKIGDANIKNYKDMPEWMVKEDALVMGSICDAWGMQENGQSKGHPGKRDIDAVLEALGDQWTAVGEKTDVPIVYKKAKMECLGLEVIDMGWSGRVLPLTPRPRIFVRAEFKLRAREGVPSFVWFNAHLVAGGMNGPTLPDRTTQWLHEWAQLKSAMHQSRKQHYTTLLTADLNHPRPPKPLRNWTWLVGERLDRIGVSAHGTVEVEERDDGTHRLHSDHNAQWTDVWFTRKD